MGLYKVWLNNAPGAKNGSALGSHVLHRLIRKHKKTFLSEMQRPRAVMCGMSHHLVDLYHVCSVNIHIAKNGPAPGVNCFTYAY